MSRKYAKKRSGHPTIVFYARKSLKNNSNIFYIKKVRKSGEPASGKIYLPEGDEVETVTVSSQNGGFELDADPFHGSVNFEITSQ